MIYENIHIHMYKFCVIQKSFLFFRNIEKSVLPMKDESPFRRTVVLKIWNSYVIHLWNIYSTEFRLQMQCNIFYESSCKLKFQRLFVLWTFFTPQINIFVNAHVRVIGYNNRKLKSGHGRSDTEVCPYKIINITQKMDSWRHIR